MQLKHNEKGDTIPSSSLINMLGDIGLFKYFESYCNIKSDVSTHENLKHSGQFDGFDFVIYNKYSQLCPFAARYINIT
jgi:hypothetical protein